MGYLVQKSRVARVIVGGLDYTSSLVSFQVSDAGAFKKGLVTTSGMLILGQRPGQANIEDYDRNAFKRGTVVTLDMREPGGAEYRHPRGYLHVVSTSYNVEAEQLEVEVACRISLAYLTENADAILPLVPIPLDPAQRTVENCSASFAAAGMILYQDNQGQLVSRKFFGSDSTAGIEDGAWVSVLGETALAVAPLASGAIPDEIDLSYQVPEGLLADDNLGKVDTVVETSQYFVNYPATVWKRNPNPSPSGVINLPGRLVPRPPVPRPPLNCGQTPQPPSPGGYDMEPGGTANYFLCNDLWTTDRTNEYLPATRVATSTTTYGAPGAQVSFVEQVTEGPEIEANSGYFADWYAFCVSTYGYACNPQGSCPYYGMDTQVLSKQLTYYEYGEANELVRTIQDSYQTLLSAYTTDDYRSGISDGVSSGFIQNLSAADGLYRVSRVITEYYKENNTNIQETTTFTSVTSRGVGPFAGVSLDALQGIRTSVRRESTTTTTLDVRPDSVNTATTSTSEQASKVIITPNGFITPPPEAGKYVIDDSVPVPLLSEDKNQIEQWVNDYTNYLVRFTRGDLYGLQIAESMRSEIVADWYPGMPFRYADTANNTISAMRMDACTWGVTPEEAIVVTNGVWIGFSSGTLNIGSNLVGNSTPDMSPGLGAGIEAIGGNPNGGQNPPQPQPIAPLPPSPAPIIEDDLVGQSFEFVVDVSLWLEASVFTYTPDGITRPNPTDLTALAGMSIGPYVTGFVVETGGLLAVDGNGTIPLEYGGSIITENATIVDADLFA